MENLRTEVHQNERDFIGPVTVDSGGRALYLSGAVDGGIAVDVLVYGQEAGENALGLYTNYAQSGPIPGAAGVFGRDAGRPQLRADHPAFRRACITSCSTTLRPPAKRCRR